MKKNQTKVLYKIWDLKNEKYIAGDKSKTTWTSLKWIATKLVQLKSNHENYKRSPILDAFNPDQFEIHKCELIPVETLSAKAVLEGLEKKIEKNEINRTKIKVLKKEIIEIVNYKLGPYSEHSLDIWTIRKLFGRNIFTAKIEEGIKDLMKNLNALEKNL